MNSNAKIISYSPADSSYITNYVNIHDGAVASTATGGPAPMIILKPRLHPNRRILDAEKKKYVVCHEAKSSCRCKPLRILFHIPLTEYFLAWRVRFVLARKVFDEKKSEYRFEVV